MWMAPRPRPAAAMNQETYDVLADLIDDLELADWPRHLKDKFRDDLIRARTLIANCTLAARKGLP